MVEQSAAREAADMEVEAGCGQPASERQQAGGGAGEAAGGAAESGTAASPGAPADSPARTTFTLPPDAPPGGASGGSDRLSADEVMYSFDDLDVDIPEDRKRELVNRFIELAAKRPRPT